MALFRHIGILKPILNGLLLLSLVLAQHQLVVELFNLATSSHLLHLIPWLVAKLLGCHQSPIATSDSWHPLERMSCLAVLPSPLDLLRLFMLIHLVLTSSLSLLVSLSSISSKVYNLLFMYKVHPCPSTH